MLTYRLTNSCIWGHLTLYIGRWWAHQHHLSALTGLLHHVKQIIRCSTWSPDAYQSSREKPALTQNTSEQKGFPRGSMVKNTPANAGDLRNAGWIPGLGRSPGGGSGNPVSLAWKTPWTEEPGGLQSMGSQRVGQDWASEHIQDSRKYLTLWCWGRGGRRLGWEIAIQFYISWVSDTKESLKNKHTHMTFALHNTLRLL